MRPLTFRTKLLASHVGLVVAVVLIALLDLNRTLLGDLHRQLDARLLEQARGAAQWVGEGRRHPDKLAGRLALTVKADVTIFDRAGEVIGDSSERAPAKKDEAQMPEVVAAMRGEEGLATRKVAPSSEEMRYVAVPAGDGLVLRLGEPLSAIEATAVAVQRRLLFASGLAIVLALGLGFLASQVAARPLRVMTAAAGRLTKGDYDIDLRSTSPDEFGLLSRTLTSLATELKARIGDLVAERDRLSAILAGMAEGVVVADAQRVVVLANPAAEAIVGAHGDLVAKSIDDAIPDRALRGVVAAQGAIAGAHESDVETADGKSITLYVRPLAAGAGGGSVTVLRDMTRIRRLLTMRRDFVANVSHELRTPVAAIQGYAETLLGTGTDPATQRQFLEIVHRQAQRIGALVSDLLTLSELEARPRGDTTREPVDLAALSTHVAQTVRARASEHGVRVTLEVAEGTRALGDPVGVEQVLQNLVDNAIKYGRRGGEVRVTGSREADRVVLAVTDDGPGIAPEHLPRIFERFYRVDGGRSRERGGTGLGLAIVKHLVESMGGAVRVESAVDSGTTFRIDLPRA